MRFAIYHTSAALPFAVKPNCPHPIPSRFLASTCFEAQWMKSLTGCRIFMAMLIQLQHVYLYLGLLDGLPPSAYCQS